MFHTPREAVRINEFEAHNDLSDEICSVSAKFYFILLQIRCLPIYEKNNKGISIKLRRVGNTDAFK